MKKEVFMSTDWAAHDLTVQNYHGGNLAATSRIRHVLIAAITAGDIAPGARLKEIDLGQQLGVSTASTRLAMPPSYFGARASMATA